MSQYVKSEFRFIRNLGRLSSAEIEKLSDEELVEYLRKCNFNEEKRKYRIKSGSILREISDEYAIVIIDGII